MKTIQLISLNNVTCELRTSRIKTIAVDGVNLKINQGEFVTISGSSGAGKSTLLKVLGLLQMPSNGDIDAFGHKIKNKSYATLARIRRHNIGFIFQSFLLLPDLNVIENIEIALKVTGKYNRKHSRNEINKLLKKFDLSARSSHYPQQLSGGQQQRVAIIRAIITRPKIILADEPTGNLDREAKENVLSVLLDLVNEGISLCLVSHDSTVTSLGKRRLKMIDGKVFLENEVNR